MEVALYVRVSTDRQQQRQTIEQQITRLREYSATHPDWHVADTHIYRDDGYSGTKLNRPGLDRLRDHARGESLLKERAHAATALACAEAAWLEASEALERA